MPDLQDGIDRISRAFAVAIQVGKQRIAGHIAGLIERGATLDDVARALSAVTVDDLLAASGIGQSVDDMVREYGSTVLSRMQQFAPVSDAALQALIEADAARWMQLARLEIADLSSALRQAVLTGGNGRAIRALAGTGLSSRQVETLVNTALNTFSRTVGAIQAQAAPEDKLYVYLGPVDGRTRDLCLAMAASGELTYAEIERRFPGAFRDGGGFNCRHQWVPAASTDRRLESQAQDAITAQGTRWTTPQTVLQQLEGAQ